MDAIIRPATVADIPAIVELGRNFIANTQYAVLITPDPAAMEATVRFLVDNHVVLVAERFQGPVVGMLGMATYPHVVSGQPCAVELFWWVEPDYRGCGVQMLRRAEKWAKAQGARFIQMVQPESEPRLGDVYQRLGYTLTERQFQKFLG